MASTTTPSRSVSATAQRAPRQQRQPRAPRGTGFDLSGRQSRIRRQESNARHAAQAEAYQGASIGDLINSAIENSHKTKKGKTKPASFSASSYAHGRDNETAIDSRHNQRAPRKSHKTSKPKPAQEYNALSDDFGPALGPSAPLATHAVSWGAHLNHRPKPAPKEPSPDPEPELPPEPSPELPPEPSVLNEPSESKEATVSQITEQGETQDIEATSTDNGFTGFNDGPIARAATTVAWGDMVDSDDDEDDDDVKQLADGDSWADTI